MSIGNEELQTLVATQLQRRLRYRCLVLQTGSVRMLQELRDGAMLALQQLGSQVHTLEYRELLDQIGAFPCSRVLERIESLADTCPLILAGPLHFVDYWSQGVAAGFWEYLASYSTGPGILVVDTPREQSLQGAFRLLRIIPRTDIRVFKSRLATAQDGLV